MNDQPVNAPLSRLDSSERPSEAIVGARMRRPLVLSEELFAMCWAKRESAPTAPTNQ